MLCIVAVASKAYKKEEIRLYCTAMYVIDSYKEIVSFHDVKPYEEKEWKLHTRSGLGRTPLRRQLSLWSPAQRKLDYVVNKQHFSYYTETLLYNNNTI